MKGWSCIHRMGWKLSPIKQNKLLEERNRLEKGEETEIRADAGGRSTKFKAGMMKTEVNQILTTFFALGGLRTTFIDLQCRLMLYCKIWEVLPYHRGSLGLMYCKSCDIGLSTRDLGSVSGIWIQRPLCLHTASISGSELRAMLRDSEWDPVKQCNAHSLCAVWSSRVTTLNPDRGSGSSKSVSVPVWRGPLNR